MTGKAGSAGNKSTLRTRPAVYSGRHGHHHGHGQNHDDVLVPRVPALSVTSDGSRLSEGWGSGAAQEAENAARRSAGLALAVPSFQRFGSAKQTASAVLDVLTVRGVPAVAVARTVRGFELAQRWVRGGEGGEEGGGL